MKELDNLTPIQDKFEKFVYKCQENYQVGEYSTVDKRLESFRGCKFRQYICNNSAKYGIKMYALVDSRFSFTLATWRYKQETSRMGLLRRLQRSVPSMFGFQKDSILLSYKLKHQKNVLMLYFIMETEQSADMSEIVTSYNLTTC